MEKEAVLHCLRAMIDEELCEECPLYGTTGTDHCEKDCVRLAIEELEKKPCDDDAISRKEAISIAGIATLSVNQVVTALEKLPSVNPQKPICPSAGIDCEDCPAYEKKSEWEHDHEILKAYSDGASAVLDNVRAEIESKYESIPETFHHYETGFTDALEWVLSVIDKHKAESEEKEK